LQDVKLKLDSSRIDRDTQDRITALEIRLQKISDSEIIACL